MPKVRIMCVLVLKLVTSEILLGMRSHGPDICPVLDSLLNDEFHALWVVFFSILEQKVRVLTP